jgi:hypothetical protein
MTVTNTRFESYLETLVWETDLEKEGLYPPFF